MQEHFCVFYDTRLYATTDQLQVHSEIMRTRRRTKYNDFSLDKCSHSSPPEMLSCQDQLSRLPRTHISLTDRIVLRKENIKKEKKIQIFDHKMSW